MTERRQNTGDNGDDEAREGKGKDRAEQDASREAVEEEEKTGGPRTEGE